VKVHDDFLNHKMKKLIIHVVGIKNAATDKDKNTKEGILTIELRNIPKYFFEEHRQLIAHENSKESKKSQKKSLGLKERKVKKNLILKKY
jgi:hypothetical protein